MKLTDAKAGLSNQTRWPGADIDAVGCIGCEPVPKEGRAEGKCDSAPPAVWRVVTPPPLPLYVYTCIKRRVEQTSGF